MKPEDKQKQFMDWCYQNNDIPIVRGFLGSLDCIGALDKHGTPKRLFLHAIEIRDYLEGKIAEFRGDSE